MEESIAIINCPASWLNPPPLSLIFLERYLASKGKKTKLIDLNIEIFNLTSNSKKDWLKLNKDFENNIFSNLKKNHNPFLKNFINSLKPYAFIGFSILKRNSAFSFALADEIKRTYPEKKIIFGGPQTLFLDLQNQIPKTDYWVVGEGEIALDNITAGRAERITRFDEIEDLDTLPFYDLSSLNPGATYNCAPLLSSRGCPYRCNFCSERLLYKKLRCHSPQYITEQIIHLKKQNKVTNFVFCDSLINYDDLWLETFCRLVISRKLNITWQAQMRIKKGFSLSLAKLIRMSGCVNLFIGLESVSDNTLKAMNKGYSKNTAISFLSTLKQAGLQFEISLIIGYPKESETDFKETYDFLKTSRNLIPKIAQINPFVDYLGHYPNRSYPNTQGKQRVEKTLEMIQAERIKYTSSFINNLTY
ncbi:MAG: radical SAM protein [Candidatus Omnitrophica bacterium]|nr:radical SAM protein [Candidatus Omnitrophota bacterium]